MTYFKNITTLTELRSQYKQLLKKYHPDNKGGSEEITKTINKEYEQLFKQLKDNYDAKQETNKGSAYESAYNKNMYDWENDKVLREMLQRIINFNGIEIELIGQWIWVFNSYAYRKELKALGFKYAGQKKAWYYHTEAFRKTSNRTLSFDNMRKRYGSTVFHTESYDLLEA